MLLADTDDNMCIAAGTAVDTAGTAEPAGKDTVGQIEAPMRLAVLVVLPVLAVVLVLLAGLVIQTGDTDILGIEDTADILGIVDIPDTECNAAYAVRLADVEDTEDIHEEYQE